MRAAGLILALCVAAVGGWWAGGYFTHAGEQIARTPVYDHQVAYHIASLGVPPESQEYFMFDLNSESNPEKLGQEMAEALVAANEEKKSLGIIGDDTQHNLKVLEKAVQDSAGKTFPDIRLIFVGPQNMQSKVEKAAAPLKARLEYLVYA